jgi:DNA polymerase III epsilon subunit family exonuclease
MTVKKCPKCGAELITVDGRRRCMNFPIRCLYQEKLSEIDPLNSEYIVFDTETTGLNRTVDKIIELAAIRVKDGKIVDRYDEFIYPGTTVKANITQLTGITNNMLLGQPEENTRIPEFVQFLEKEPYEFVVAHNGNFDFEMLKAACRRIGVPMPMRVLVDTIKVAKAVLPKGAPGSPVDYKQVTLAQHYGIKYSAHRAINDVEALNSVYRNLCKDAEKNGVNVMDYREF